MIEETFHRNIHEPKGLITATRELLRRPPVGELEDARREQQASLRPTEFLRLFTSATEWQPFAAIAARAEELSPNIFKHSLQVTLCRAVKEGWFEKRAGKQVVYRRVEGTFIEVPKATGGARKRKFLSHAW